MSLPYWDQKINLRLRLWSWRKSPTLWKAWTTLHASLCNLTMTNSHSRTESSWRPLVAVNFVKCSSKCSWLPCGCYRTSAALIVITFFCSLGKRLKGWTQMIFQQFLSLAIRVLSYMFFSMVAQQVLSFHWYSELDLGWKSIQFGWKGPGSWTDQWSILEFALITEGSLENDCPVTVKVMVSKSWKQPAGKGCVTQNGSCMHRYPLFI
jgi:hypothetical protein